MISRPAKLSPVQVQSSQENVVEQSESKIVSRRICPYLCTCVHLKLSYKLILFCDVKSNKVTYLRTTSNIQQLLLI